MLKHGLRYKLKYGRGVFHKLWFGALVIVAAPILLSGFTEHCPWCAPVATMTTPRATHSATLLPDGDVLVAGGMTHNSEYLATAELYHSRTRTFSPTGSMPAPRGGHTATLLRTGKVLITGGYNGTEKTLSSAVLYDPAKGTFTPTGSMEASRGENSATLLADGRVLIAGGEDHDVATATAELYDPANGHFSPTGSMHIARAYHVAALLAGDRVLVAGGGPDLHHVVASAEVYDARTGRFTPVGDMSSVRRKATATTLRDGRVLITGGADERDSEGRLASAELFDPATLRFHRTPTMASPRYKDTRAAVLQGDGTVLIAGGGRGVEVYDPAANRFHAIAGGPDAPRYYSTATLLSDGAVLVVGGYGDDYGQSDARAWVIGSEAMKRSVGGATAASATGPDVRE